MKFLKCAICKDQQKLKVLYKANFDLSGVDEDIFSARRTSNIFHYQFNKCLKCNLIFSSPVLEEKKINNLYTKSKFNYIDQTVHLRKTYIDYLKKYFPKTESLKKTLDVGCGNGFFLEELKDSRVKEVYGVEPSRDAVSKARSKIKERIKVDILKENLYPKSFFSLISCFHTLDHIVEPNGFLKIVYKLLKKGGVVYFIVHDTDGLSVKFFKEKSPIFDIEHIYLFNKDNLKKIFSQNGFKKIEVFPIKNEYPFNYWLERSPLPTMIKKIGKLPLLSKLLSQSVSINAGNIGIIAYK